MEEKKQIEEMIAEIEIAREICGKPCDICNSDESKCIPHRMARKLVAAGYRKQSEVASEIPAVDACLYCEEGDEKCGTCVRFFDYYEDGGGERCSSAFDSEKCVAYKPMNYCSMCGRKMKGD